MNTEKRIQVKINSETMRALKVKCAREGVTLSDVVRRLLLEWLKTK